MKRILTLLALALTCALSQARSLRTFDGKEVPVNFLNVYRLYPAHEAQQVKAPAGYKAVYIAHYGRHGSRYVLDDTQYGRIEKALRLSHDSGKLNPTGERLWRDFSKLYPLLEGNSNALTPLGLEQHRGIASRMAANFPELLESATVEAIASPMPRTEQSMEAFCTELSSHFPDLKLEFGPARLPALNPYSRSNGVATEDDIIWKGDDSPNRASVRELSEKLVSTDSFIARIFNDISWAKDSVDVRGLMSDLYYVGISIPSTPVKGYDLCNYLTLEEVEGFGRVENYLAFCNKGHMERFGSHGRQWALGSYVLDDLVERTVEDLADGRYSARLRFGHDGCLMGMYATLGIGPWNCREYDPAKASLIWDSSQTPMACNLQVIIYRNRTGKMLLRVLYNERDFDLPLKKVKKVFYRPDDVLCFCREKLSAARQVLEK